MNKKFVYSLVLCIGMLSSITYTREDESYPKNAAKVLLGGMELFTAGAIIFFIKSFDLIPVVLGAPSLQDISAITGSCVGAFFLAGNGLYHIKDGGQGAYNKLRGKTRPQEIAEENKCFICSTENNSSNLVPYEPQGQNTQKELPVDIKRYTQDAPNLFDDEE